MSSSIAVHDLKNKLIAVSSDISIIEELGVNDAAHCFDRIEKNIDEIKLLYKEFKSSSYPIKKQKPPCLYVYEDDESMNEMIARKQKDNFKKYVQRYDLVTLESDLINCPEGSVFIVDCYYNRVELSETLIKKVISKKEINHIFMSSSPESLDKIDNMNGNTIQKTITGFFKSLNTKLEDLL